MKKFSTPKLVQGHFFWGLVTFLICFLIGAGFLFGWVLSGHHKGNREENAMKSLRLSGFKYINPLLACDTELEFSSERMDKLSEKIKQFIEGEKTQGKIEEVSVYVRDYQDGTSFEVNPTEKFYPASLGKIPAMIATFKQSESQPNFLKALHKYSDQDHNQGVEIQPGDTLQKDNTYTALDAIDKMIRYSDNNGYYFLSTIIDINLFKKTFKDLKIPLREDLSTPEDYMTAKEFSYFLRVLYNSTYLNQSDSEKAMEYLSKSEYKNGLAAGLPPGSEVAHKFGINTKKDSNGNIIDRELHDCGFVYKDKPYLICVMTKGTSSLSDSESVIKEISKIVYRDIRE